MCCFKKIYKYPFLLYKYLQCPLFIMSTVHVCLALLQSSLPPSRSQPDVYLHFPVEAVRGGGTLLRRSPCRGRVVVGRDGGSNFSQCMEKEGSFHSSPLLTSTGFGVWVVGAQVLSHSSSHWCSPWLLPLRSFSG